jgi:outer membrane protein assembly factor BamB
VGEPVVANGIVYLTTKNDYLYALSASDGSLVWRFHGDDASAGGPPTVANGVVYFGATNTCNSYSPSPPYLYAVNAATGALIWRVGGTAFPGKLLVANGAVYSGSCEGRIAAYRASDGGQIWGLSLGGGCSTNELAVDATYLYIDESACYGVVALRVGDGSGAWQQPLGGGGAPTLVNGVLYVGNRALRASDGAILRAFFQVSPGPLGTDAVADGVVYISDSETLFAWNTTTGAQIWQVAPQGGAYIFGVGNGAIYAGNGHNLYAYQTSDGTQLWSALVDHSVVSQFDPLPVSLGSTLYVGTLTGTVVALRASDGAILWRTTLQ